MPGMLKPVAGLAAKPKGPFRASFRPGAAQALAKPAAPKQPQAPKQPGFAGSAPKPPTGPKPFAKRDSQFRDDLKELQPKKRTKSGMERRIAAQKHLQAISSVTGGTLGLAALATRGRSAQLSRAARGLKDSALVARAEKLKDTSTALTTAGAGVGGVSAFNFASYTNAEAKLARKKKKSEVEKMLDPVKTDPFGIEKAWSFPRLRRVPAGKHVASGSVGEKVDAAMDKVPLGGRVIPVEAGNGKRAKVVSSSPPVGLPRNGEVPSKADRSVPVKVTVTRGRPESEVVGTWWDKRTPNEQTAILIGGAAAGAGAVGYYGGQQRERRRNN